VIEKQEQLINIVKDFIENSKNGDLDDVVYGVVDKDDDKDNDPQCNI
jgi:hypothetical protein